jgi:hypothetical protein
VGISRTQKQNRSLDLIQGAARSLHNLILNPKTVSP